MSSGETALRIVAPPVASDPGLVPATQALPAATREYAGDAARPALFASDAATGADTLPRLPQAGMLAELAAHKRLETPACIGLFGGAGTGKTTLLNQVLQGVEELGEAAAELGETSPFLPVLLTVRVDATGGEEPGPLLMDAVAGALAVHHPKLAADLRHAGGDPVKTARETGEALNEARRRLDTERQSLDALGARDARVLETALFESGGSRVDAYARGNRSRIERALRGFGFTGGDSVKTYKDLVREAAETSGPMSRLGIALRALWAYPGQMRLIVMAVLLGLVAWGASALAGDQDAWLASVRDTSDRMAPTADWLQTHAHWLPPVHTAALVLAGVALVWLLVRAARFLQPIFKGVTLLRHDVDGRRRDLAGLLAHQTRRVETLATEAEAAATLFDEAERRAAAHKATGLTIPQAPGGASRDAVTTFFEGLGAAIGTGASDAPRRIVLALDGLDQIPATAAARLLATARQRLGAGIVTLLAASRSHLASGFAETDPAFAAAELARCVQLPFNLETLGVVDPAMLARRLLSGEPTSALEGRGGSLDARRSVFDQPWRSHEAETVAALAPSAGESPRAIKRFVNLYRIARADPRLDDAPAPVFTALALALALDAHGLSDDMAALASQTTPLHGDSAALRQAVATARGASGQPIELAQAQRALEVARSYSARG